MKEIKKKTIAIIGGGPAGSYLGYCLAKNGFHPMIFDDSHPREKPCGGGVSCLSIKRFPILHQVPVGKSPENMFLLISPEKQRVLVKGDMASWALPRKEMDGFLLNKAIEQGCDHINEHVKDIAQQDNGWHIKTINGTYSADILIGADGVKSIVRKKIVGPISKDNLSVCYGCYAVGKHDEQGTIKFLKNKRGYAWCFPRHNHLSIGVGVDYQDGKQAKQLFQEFFDEHYSDTTVTSFYGALIPFVKDPNFFDKPCCGQNWLLVGDAAGHVDPLTGEGIPYALWGAELASEAIRRGDILSFDACWREAYGEGLVKACKMHDLFYNPFLLELVFFSASLSKTLSNILYDMLNSIEDNTTISWKLIKNLPRIGKEIIKNKLKQIIIAYTTNSKEITSIGGSWKGK